VTRKSSRRSLGTRSQARRLTAALAASALVASGCGGSFKSDYSRSDSQLEKLGTDLSQTVRTTHPTDATLASRFDGYAARARKIESDLGKLTPPAKAKADLTKLRAALGVIAGDMSAAASAARAHNPRGYNAAVLKLYTDAAQVRSPSGAIRQMEGIKRKGGG